MAVNNSLTPREDKKPAFSLVVNSPAYTKMINNTLRDQNKADRFVTSIISSVAVTPALSECTPDSIISAALLGETLGLSPSPQLGQFYMVPYDDKKRGRKVAQFQLGYKGYIQLAIRSGNYKKINVLPIKEGELVHFDPLNEEIDVRLIEDDEERENAPTVGYYAMFEYLNGFKKAIYWSKKKMLRHADKYSAAFSLEARPGKYPKVSYADYVAGNYDPKTEWLYSSFWYKDFDGMAQKTMLRQLISKWGIMSIEMQKAFDGDMSLVNEDGTFDYVDNADNGNVIEGMGNVIETPENVPEQSENVIPPAENVQEAFFK